MNREKDLQERLRAGKPVQPEKEKCGSCDGPIDPLGRCRCFND